MQTINAFNDIENKPIENLTGKVAGVNLLSNVGQMQVGFGSKVIRADESGFWLGSDKFATAPFSVDMEGNLIATTATFGQYISKIGTGQNVTGDFQLGVSNVKVDGANKRIIINDGTNDRILLGFQSGGF